MNWNACFWMVLTVALLVAESATVTLISLWFAAGALTAMVVSLLGGGIWVQVTGFLVVSVVLLTALRPLVRKYVAPKVTKTNVDAVVGAAGLVTIPIDNITASGQVKLGAMYWSARSTSGDPIPEGTRVTVDRIEGVKVFVTPVEVPANV